MTGVIFSRPLDVGSIALDGFARHIEASEAERAALAKAYGLRELKALIAELDVSRKPGGVIAIDGRVHAELVQTCVVSLEPVDQVIDELVEVRYAPEGASAAPPTPKPGAEVRIDPDADDPPEALAGNAIDLGAIAEEHFALAIDPYPRAPGAELPAEAADPEGPADSPFAALAALRGKPPGGR